MAGRSERVRLAIADASIALHTLSELTAELERERDNALERLAETDQELKEERERLRPDGCEPFE